MATFKFEHLASKEKTNSLYTSRWLLLNVPLSLIT